MQTAEEIIRYISESKKKTPVKVYLRGKLDQIAFPEGLRPFVGPTSGVVFGEWSDVQAFLQANRELIEDYEVEADRRNSAIPLLDLKDIPARIEPGAIIRDKVKIGENAVIMMGAIINIGAEVGPGTMIDMGAVLGGRATVGANCHIGAGAVLAGVIEPPSAKPVVIEDNVLVGANAVILEGVRVGKGAVVAAGAVVIEDVPPGTVVAGVPAKVIKRIEDVEASKIEIKEELRRL
ncbi:2,3,4,5-tetrahydropyridine-2,6-dicarboxylate N-acetyltransferase [Alicyclobacillus acidocaldarius]|uniref:2,3,4,5-tetrahydropyridine-2,6-dicarboxylate N-acetyltransferase n=1 Tax=Alicyclobacillus acidocaldarius TaxID=405212 RepID=UPI00018A70DE